MTTSIFVETETPGALFFAPRGGARGGFGEMTVFKQRFSRWNFFFSSGLYWNFEYILLDWKLGFWELGAKLFVFQEVCLKPLCNALLVTAAYQRAMLTDTILDL
jgi:hypothetical protein